MKTAVRQSARSVGLLRTLTTICCTLSVYSSSVEAVVNTRASTDRASSKLSNTSVRSSMVRIRNSMRGSGGSAIIALLLLPFRSPAS